MSDRARHVDEIVRIGHDEAMSLARVEGRKLSELLTAFSEPDWERPTDCARWTVRDVVAHLIGSAEAQASVREFVRQVRRARPIGREIDAEFWWDGVNELQVRERRNLSSAQMVAAWADASERSIAARERLPRPIAGLPLLVLPPPVGRQPVRYLFDMGATRDVWVHRIDLARATGVSLDHDAHHDGRIVADIVAEWAASHGQPFQLELVGAAGGRFASGSGGEHVTVEVDEFARILSERVRRSGVLANVLPL